MCWLNWFWEGEELPIVHKQSENEDLSYAMYLSWGKNSAHQVVFNFDCWGILPEISPSSLLSLQGGDSKWPLW